MGCAALQQKSNPVFHAVNIIGGKRMGFVTEDYTVPFCTPRSDGAEITQWTRIQEDPGSIPGPAILISVFHDFPKSLQANARMGPLQRPWPIPSQSFPQSLFPVQLAPLYLLWRKRCNMMRRVSVFALQRRALLGSRVVEARQWREYSGSMPPRCSAPTVSKYPEGLVNGTLLEFSLQATVTEWLACSPPTKAIQVQSPGGSLRIFACGNRAGPTDDAVGRYCSVLTSTTLIGSQDLDVKNCRTLFTQFSLTWLVPYNERSNSVQDQKQHASSPLPSGNGRNGDMALTAQRGPALGIDVEIQPHVLMGLGGGGGTVYNRHGSAEGVGPGLLYARRNEACCGQPRGCVPTAHRTPCPHPPTPPLPHPTREKAPGSDGDGCPFDIAFGAQSCATCTTHPRSLGIATAGDASTTGTRAVMRSLIGKDIWIYNTFTVTSQFSEDLLKFYFQDIPHIMSDIRPNLPAGFLRYQEQLTTGNSNLKGGKHRNTFTESPKTLPRRTKAPQDLAREHTN
ncbi:hypothetical protein PR048_015142 [Dryococelus australis]|uniref:Uncharacterized protein n=1 Tax=Dryococelus australis TaxID=614101 RepID=A0ABQ9HGC7_9NEOP|nr:hypothetical protein PR048_015142 [Dryococelus australis]